MQKIPHYQIKMKISLNKSCKNNKYRIFFIITFLRGSIWFCGYLSLRITFCPISALRISPVARKHRLLTLIFL